MYLDPQAARDKDSCHLDLAKQGKKAYIRSQQILLGSTNCGEQYQFFRSSVKLGKEPLGVLRVKQLVQS